MSSTTSTKTYRLSSNEMVSAPGLLRWAVNGAKFQRDREAMVSVMHAGWPEIAKETWAKVLTGEIPHFIDGDSVVIEVPAA